ncbi:MAG TPA: DUF3095 family protein [Elusimicrobiota bacterium]|jgi:hypothetical protein|nr:DUF3095 family protein [Elusimicrobiota bacterium]
MDTSEFYAELPAFPNFSEVTGDKPFRPLPEDWKVIVADIQGSTEAIEAGRYKDVNTVGAAAVAAAQNAMDKRDFPFVFGGDGATLVVPPAAFDKVSGALDGVRALARDKFAMTLRVGAVDVAELYAEGAKVEVAKFELFAGRAIASFRGGGLSSAERKIKGDPARYAVPERAEHRSDLSGLSCRWKPIPSDRGVILSILIGARAEAGSRAVYDKVLKRLEDVFNGDLFNANPVHLSTMSYRSVWENLAAEARCHRDAVSLAFLARAAEIVASVLVFKWKVPPLVFDPKKYAESMSAHSDFRKFDDILRMVVDCSPAQAAAIRSFLDELRAKDEICFGLHESKAALMTCFVYDVKDGGHIHFIDGGDGGYALAAKQFKAQLKS